MKGKIAFVVGAAVGYVLGTRAGRERYEQIKRGATTVWNTEPVQKGVGTVKGVLDDKADDLKAFIRKASSDAFANLAKQTGERADAGASSARAASSRASSARTASTASTTSSAADEAQQKTEADS